MSKKSIRFFNDHEVRAVWDEANLLLILWVLLQKVQIHESIGVY